MGHNERAVGSVGVRDQRVPMWAVWGTYFTSCPGPSPPHPVPESHGHPHLPSLPALYCQIPLPVGSGGRGGAGRAQQGVTSQPHPWTAWVWRLGLMTLKSPPSPPQWPHPPFSNNPHLSAPSLWFLLLCPPQTLCPVWRVTFTPRPQEHLPRASPCPSHGAASCLCLCAGNRTAVVPRPH